LRGWLRSSDIGCGFEDAGPVRPEDCFPVPSLSVVRGGASASPAGREFEIAYVDGEYGARRLALIDAWSVPFEECMPVRGFPSYKGQRNHVGRWWTATTRSLVGYESWLERDWLMLLDFDPDVVGIAAQPFWLLWTTPEGKPCSHAPDYFARSAGGAALVMDCRPADRIKPRDADAFAVTRAACELVGWRYEVAGSPVPVVVGNVRWLSGYRHPRHDLPDVAAALQVAFAAPTGLMAGAESVGDPIAVLPALWRPGGKPNSPPSPRQSRPWKRPGTRCRLAGAIGVGETRRRPVRALARIHHQQQGPQTAAAHPDRRRHPAPRTRSRQR